MRQLKITHSITNRESASLDKYLQEIGREELISVEEEVELAGRIRNGDRAALEKLTKSNLRFVVSVAKQYQNQGLSLPDLINEGNVGLINAAQRFDPTRGFRFTSYAIWWVRQAIILAIISEGRIVHLPENLQEAGRQISHFAETFQQSNERMPTAEEISEALNMPLEHVQLIQRSMGYAVSIDTPLDDEGCSMLDFIHAEGADAEEQMASKEFRADIDSAIDALPCRERETIRMYFGIGGPEMSLDEIGSRIGLSRERTRQLKEKAIDMLRTAQFGHALRSYIE